MYDTLYAILNKGENATLQYFIFCEKELNQKYLLKLNNVFRHPASDSSNAFSSPLFCHPIASGTSRKGLGLAFPLFSPMAPISNGPTLSLEAYE